MAQNNDTGRWGESVATEILISKGYSIRDVNWKIPPYEIDIVAMKNNRIVFVEVKTRSSGFVDPETAVDRRKQSKLIKAANAYVKTFSIPHEIQFDLIFIIGNPLNYTLEHIPDAFYPPLKTY